MKRQIRYGVFETNSSSTHSMTICTKEEYDKWVKGELLFSRWGEEFANPEDNDTLTNAEKEVVKEKYNNKKQRFWKDWEELSNEEKEELYSEEIERKKSYNDLVTYNEYFDDSYLEGYEKHYTTPKGEEIVIFGKYGYDG